MYAMPGLASFLTPSDLQAFRSGASPASLARTLGSKSLLPGLSASPPPPPSFPLSPPLHQQLPLPPHAQGALLSPPVSMSPATQPPVLPTPMALQVQLAMSPSPPGPQVSRDEWERALLGPLVERGGSLGFLIPATHQLCCCSRGTVSLRASVTTSAQWVWYTLSEMCWLQPPVHKLPDRFFRFLGSSRPSLSRPLSTSAL